MKWSEVRTLYPNQFVKIEILKSHTEEDRIFVDDMAIIKPINSDNATNELLKSKGNILVYRTSKDEVSMIVRKRVGLMRML